jgi:hypothetical protein
LLAVTLKSAEEPVLTVRLGGWEMMGGRCDQRREVLRHQSLLARGIFGHNHYRVRAARQIALGQRPVCAADDRRQRGRHRVGLGKKLDSQLRHGEMTEEFR